MDESLTPMMTNKDKLIRQHPEFPWLSLDDIGQLDSFMRQRDWLGADEQIVHCEKPGEGNMNLTVRAVTNQRRLIVKQARPWVEKYDHIPAPWDRAEFEQRFYQRIQKIPDVAAQMPKLLCSDMAARVLVLEDLGDAQPLVSLYSGDTLAEADLRQLGSYLRCLHEATRGPADPDFANLEMRQLNHQHIFEIPLAAESGIDLEQFETGLTAAATNLRNDSRYRELVRATGDRYLSSGPVLIHGDFFPGSWLRGDQCIYMIDPEFCFFGDPEFDLACAVAHLYLAQQPRQHAEKILQSYSEHQNETQIDSSRLASYAAAEVMRRLIGVAQLPLQTSAGQRAEMLERSRLAMIAGTWEQLWD